MPTRLPDREKPETRGQTVYVMICYVTIVLILMMAAYGLSLQATDF